MVLGFVGWGVWIDTQSAGFSVKLTSSPVELGISGRVSVGEDGRAGESRVGQSGRQGFVALFCRAGGVGSGVEWSGGGWREWSQTITSLRVYTINNSYFYI